VPPENITDVWSSLRDRLLASPRFHRWASWFPLTRLIARHRAGKLFDLCAGFVYSQILFACVAARLLDAAVALQLVEKRSHGRYGLGPLGAVMPANPGIQAMIRHHSMLYEDLRDPQALLKSCRPDTRLASYWPYAGSARAADLDSEQVAAYSELMATSQPVIAEEILAVYPLHHHQCLLDVGGGDGVFLAAAAERAPHMKLMLFDLPAVVAQARRRFAAARLEHRVESTGGDFFVDPLPGGADIISLIRVAHDHSDEDVQRLLASIHRRLPVGGTLLLAEPMAGHSDTDRAANAYFGFYLLAMGKGRPRTPGEIGVLLKRAGFRRHRLLANPMPLQTRIIIADR